MVGRLGSMFQFLFFLSFTLDEPTRLILFVSFLLKPPTSCGSSVEAGIASLNKLQELRTRMEMSRTVVLHMFVKMLHVRRPFPVRKCSIVLSIVLCETKWHLFSYIISYQLHIGYCRPSQCVNVPSFSWDGQYRHIYTLAFQRPKNKWPWANDHTFFGY